jgi:hypothetical protein
MTCSVDGCTGTSRKRGMCAKHYNRWWKHGDPLVLARAPNGVPMKWLNQHIGYDGDSCLAWPFHRDERGRARVDVNRHQKNAARVMCEKVNGPPPDETHQAAHSCGKGHEGCVNPNHLSWKTPAENQSDRVVHGTMYPENVRHNTSGVPGVGWHKKSQKWRAYVSEKNRQVSLGFFPTIEEAIEARVSAIHMKTMAALGGAK